MLCFMKRGEGICFVDVVRCRGRRCLQRPKVRHPFLLTDQAHNGIIQTSVYSGHGERSWERGGGSWNKKKTARQRERSEQAATVYRVRHNWMLPVKCVADHRLNAITGEDWNSQALRRKVSKPTPTVTLYSKSTSSPIMPHLLKCHFP